MTEVWKSVPGYEGAYEVSDQGNVRSVDTRVPYNHWRSRERLWRLKRGKKVPAQRQNSGYLLVHLHRENKRVALTVHRLVAGVFVNGTGREVNHLNGDKTDNRASNLQWTSSRLNHDHAVDVGLIGSAIRCRCPKTGQEFPSINRAAKTLRKSPKTIRNTFARLG